MLRDAQAGNAYAQLHIKKQLVKSYFYDNPVKARAWLTQAAQAGHTEAQFWLGYLLIELQSSDQMRARAEARAWWTQAAQAGHTEAQFRLGRLLTEPILPPELVKVYGWRFAERIDPPELAEARAWWTQAAQAGHTRAQVRLGRLLTERIDPPELAEARSWFTRAAEAGDQEAKRYLRSTRR